MALIRGAKGNFPCPICLVPGEGMCKGSVGDLCTTESTKQIYNEAAQMDSAELRENLLKAHGL